MKTRNNILYAILVSTIFLAVSCVEKSPEYVPGEVPAGAQVFFPNTVPVGTINLDETKPIAVPVTRVESGSALSVPVIAEAASGFNVPATVEFAAGQKTTDLVITFDASKFQRGETYDLNLTLGKETTPYGLSTYFFSVYVNPWESLGMGQWFDQLALMSSDSYGIQEVEVLHNGVRPELYRIMKPYANNAQLAAVWSAENIGGPKSEYIEFWVKEDGVHLSWDKFWYTGLIYTPGDPTSSIKAYLPSVRNPANSDADSQFLSVNSENDVARLVPYYYIDGLGGFGKYPCYLSFPGGPDLNEIL